MADGLSNREKAVLRLLAWGFTNKEVADKLSISVKTVDTYRVRLAWKRGLKSRAALVAYAVEHRCFRRKP
jgi:two-component system, NarL family, response regulator NreC